MIKAKKHPILSPALNQYFKYMVKKQFHTLEVIDYPETLPQSVLLISNHVSWWDGFIPYVINQKQLKKEFKIMMLERELIKAKFLRHAGAYSIALGERSVVESIRYTQELLSTPENLVVMFPQGIIHSCFQHTIKFQPGVHTILKGVEKTTVLFQVLFLDWLNYKKATATAYYRTFDMREVNEIEANYQLFYNECLMKQEKRKA